VRRGTPSREGLLQAALTARRVSSDPLTRLCPGSQAACRGVTRSALREAGAPSAKRSGAVCIDPAAAVGVLSTRATSSFARDSLESYLTAGLVSSYRASSDYRAERGEKMSAQTRVPRALLEGRAMALAIEVGHRRRVENV